VHVVTVMTVGSAKKVLLDEAIGLYVTPEMNANDEVIIVMLLEDVELDPCWIDTG